VAGTFDEVIELLKTTAKPWRMTFEEQVRTYLIICALSNNPHTNLHINKSREA
jgi:hypothetical protein